MKRRDESLRTIFSFYFYLQAINAGLDFLWVLVYLCSMGKYVRTLKPEFQPKAKELEELSAKELKLMCEEADLPSSGSKEEIIKRLRDYDSGKYVKPVIYTTSDPEDKKTTKILFIGVYKNDKDNMMKINKLHISGEARFHHYASDYYFYQTQTRIKLD
jgi:hypothetical protein